MELSRKRGFWPSVIWPTGGGRNGVHRSKRRGFKWWPSARTPEQSCNSRKFAERPQGRDGALRRPRPRSAGGTPKFHPAIPPSSLSCYLVIYVHLCSSVLRCVVRLCTSGHSALCNVHSALKTPVTAVTTRINIGWDRCFYPLHHPLPAVTNPLPAVTIDPRPASRVPNRGSALCNPHSALKTPVTPYHFPGRVMAVRKDLPRRPKYCVWFSGPQFRAPQGELNREATFRKFRIDRDEGTEDWPQKGAKGAKTKEPDFNRRIRVLHAPRPFFRLDLSPGLIDRSALCRKSLKTPDPQSITCRPKSE
jgi:hypothetical protein